VSYCKDCYPGRYCTGSNAAPVPCAFAGQCTQTRSCLSGTDCNVIQQTGASCNSTLNAICDRAVEVRPGRFLTVNSTLDSSVIPLSSVFSLSLTLGVSAGPLSFQTPIQPLRSQLSVHCTSSDVLVRNISFPSPCVLSLLVSNCNVDAHSFTFSPDSTGLIVLLGGVKCYSCFNGRQFTVLWRTGASIFSGGEGFISDLTDVTFMPTMLSPTSAPMADNSSLQNVMTYIAISLAGFIIAYVLLKAIRARLLMCYQDKGYSATIVPGGVRRD
jgi:hypothetical protein